MGISVFQSQMCSYECVGEGRREQVYRHVNVIIGKVNRLEVPRLQTFDTIDSIDTIWVIDMRKLECWQYHLCSIHIIGKCYIMTNGCRQLRKAVPLCHLLTVLQIK